jgi:hypothetical protein
MPKAKRYRYADGWFECKVGRSTQDSGPKTGSTTHLEKNPVKCPTKILKKTQKTTRNSQNPAKNLKKPGKNVFKCF